MKWNEMGVQVKLWSPLRTRAISERFCGGDSLRRGAISSVWTFTFHLFSRTLLVSFLWGCQLGRVCQSSKQSILRSEWSRGTWWWAWGRVFTFTVCNVTPFCIQSTLECRSSYETERGEEREPETESFKIRALMQKSFVDNDSDFRNSYGAFCCRSSELDNLTKFN